MESGFIDLRHIPDLLTRLITFCTKEGFLHREFFS